MPGEWDTYESPEESMRRLEEQASGGDGASTGRAAGPGGPWSGAWIGGAVAAIVVLGGGLATLAVTDGDDDRAVDPAADFESLDAAVIGGVVERAVAEVDGGELTGLELSDYDVEVVFHVDSDTGPATTRTYSEFVHVDPGGVDFTLHVDEAYESARPNTLDPAALDYEELVNVVERAIAETDDPIGFAAEASQEGAGQFVVEIAVRQEGGERVEYVAVDGDLRADD